jgi:NitT/TauT family transport system permease protein
MDNLDQQLQQNVPEFSDSSSAGKSSEFDLSSSLSAVQVHGVKQILGIFGVAVLILGLWELLIFLYKIPQFVLPAPSAIAVALVRTFPTIWPHLLVTLGELAAGYVIGAGVGLILAAFLTQIPFIEKIITPYILLLVVTPAMALVPLLMMWFGFTIVPRIIAVALAAGPMVMINSTTGFRRTDLAKIALAKSYGASTLQIFIKIRFPLALPMINVGLLVGGIFGLITAIGADMVGGKNGLGNRLSYYSSLGRMAEFFALIVVVAVIGILIWIGTTRLGNKYANWKE